MGLLNSLLVLLLPVFLFCTDGLNPATVLYEPPVVFSGNINGTNCRLEGNTTYRNICRMAGDTIRMYFYTKKFAQEQMVRSGDLIRLDIMPGEVDTLIETGMVLFHLARYDGYNRSYYIVPGDTSEQYKHISIRVLSFSRRPGGRIDLDNIVIRTPVVPTTQGENLEIRDARISGTIEDTPYKARFSAAR